MDDIPDPVQATASAESDLARVQEKVEAARALLVRLLQDLVVAESRLSNTQAAQMLEANEELVAAALRSQAEAEASAQALREVSRLAELDALTQLPNRVLLRDRFAHAIASAGRHGARLALLFVDLDDFKQINDRLGHSVGDEVLKLAARRIASAIRAADTVSRHGGDEFLILLTEVSQPSDAAGAADKVIAALSAPSVVGEHEFHLKASIGISIYPDHGQDVDALIAAADAAMYRAKRHGKGSFFIHGEEAALDPGLEPPSAPLRQAGPPYGLVLTDHERRNAQLREANERLVLTALGAQELQAAAEQAHRRQSDFMAVVAQELRNPMAPIRIAASMLGRIEIEEPLLPRVQAIVERQMAQMQRLVDDLLDMSRAGAGTLRLEHSRVAMADAIGDAVTACRLAMNRRRQHFSLQLPAGAIHIKGERTRLAQIFNNLLENASSFTPEGGNISLSAVPANGAVVVTVADNGMGISAQTLPNIFEPFVQDVHAIGFNGAGLGIGLTVVRTLVEAHGGTIAATSEGSGLGSQFVVTLPRVDLPAGYGTVQT
ncbi:MAG TPA: diguanylate cyclase [Burkholderiaceae bacterium]|nr:diguanylate cyclase [Burkholderiaceae bacterium]